MPRPARRRGLGYPRAMKIMIVDDHALIREGVAAVLTRLGDDTRILQADSGRQCFELLAIHPDLDALLLDLRMASMAGFAVLELLRTQHPDIPVLVLSSSEDPADVRRAMAGGARGYCPKSAPHTSLLAALRVVLAGELYLPPFMLNASAAAPTGADNSLTARQLEVLHLLCEGRPNKDIARRLGLEERTVKGHVSAIFRALNVVHRLQAIDAARASGLVASPLS